MTVGFHINYGNRSDIGRRPTNDDCLLFDQASGLYVLCDGAKGKFGGRTAGEMVCQVIDERRGQLAQAVGPPITTEVEQAVESVLHEAHQRIIDAKAADPSLEGMTSTVVLVLHRGGQALLSHVGDSRIYLCRDHQLQRLTRDHNLENYLKDNPHLQAKTDLPGKTLVRALGLKSSSGLKVTHSTLDLLKDDLLLLCSDGLTDAVPEMTIREILSCAELETIEEVASRLVRAALTHGSMDNVSTAVLEVTDAPVDGSSTAILDVGSITGGSPSTGLMLGWITFHEGPLRSQVIPLDASNTIGADPGCRIVLGQTIVSSRHAEIFRTEHGFVVRDLGSTNGTFVNNVKVTESALVDGDVIRLGTSEMVFKRHFVADRGEPK